MVCHTVKCLVAVVLIKYRLCVVLWVLQVLLVLESAMTRLITLCPDTQLLQGEEVAQEEIHMRKDLFVEGGLQQEGTSSYKFIKDEDTGREDDDASGNDIVDDHNEGLGDGGIDGGDDAKDLGYEVKEEKESLQEDEREGVRELGKVLNRDEEEEEKKGLREEERDKIQDEMESEENQQGGEEDEPVESLVNDIVGIKGDGKEKSVRQDFEETGEIGNLIKELFGEDWGEDDVLHYLSEEEKKERKDAAEIELTLYQKEVETEKELEGMGGQENKSDQIKEQFVCVEHGKERSIMELSFENLSLHIDDIDYIDQGEYESESIVKMESEEEVNDLIVKIENEEQVNKAIVNIEHVRNPIEELENEERINDPIVKAGKTEKVEDSDVRMETEEIVNRPKPNENVAKEEIVNKPKGNMAKDEIVNEPIANMEKEEIASKSIVNVEKEEMVNKLIVNKEKEEIVNTPILTIENDETVEQDWMKGKDENLMVNLLELFPDERSILKGDFREKKMPKILQKIPKPEERLIDWERAEKVIGDRKGGERQDASIAEGEEKLEENMDNARLIEAKRKRSPSIPSFVDVQYRKRIANEEVDYAVCENFGEEEGNKVESDCLIVDDDSVFGDDEGDESDDDNHTEALNKRVKIESFSSAFSNILDGLEELGDDNSANDIEAMTDDYEETTDDYEETTDDCEETTLTVERNKKNNGMVPLDDHKTKVLESKSEVKEEEIICNLEKESKDSLEHKDNSEHEKSQTETNVNKVTCLTKQKASSHKPGTNIKVDIDAALNWIKDYPPPLSGPKCTCKVPGTPPWKLASPFPTSPTTCVREMMHQTSHKTTVVTMEQEVVTVKLRRPRCASFSPEASSHVDRNQFSRAGSGEDTMSLSPENISLEGRTGTKELKDKRRLLRSLSFFSRNSHNNLSTIQGEPTTPSPSETSSLSSPLCSSSTFTTLTTPRRWSRVLGSKRKSVQSCIFPESPFLSTNGHLPPRVRSEPNVTERRSSGSEDERMPRRFSKVWSEKRRAVKSCIFPDPEDEDLTPYGVLEPKQDKGSPGLHSVAKSLDFEETHISTSHLSMQGIESPCKTPESKVRTPDSWARSCDWSENQSDMKYPKLRPSRSEAPLPHSEPRSMSGSRVKKSLSYSHRPQSLIIIPESQIGNCQSERKQQEPILKRPQSLMIPPEIRIPKRDPGLTPPETSNRRARSQNRLSYRDLRILHSSVRRLPSSDGNVSYPLLSPSPTDISQDVGRKTSLSQKEHRKNVRSWSFSPTPASLPFKVTGSPSEKWPDVTNIGQDHPALRHRHLFTNDASPTYPSASDTVIFPWRRGDQNRSSGRSSPAPSESVSQSPSPSPYYNQSPVPEESVNGTCEVANDSRQKDSVWRRSRGGLGVSRSTRKEKASSSPVFRRASLSHSEWDIRRPWSHVYSEREAAKLSQSVCRLAMTSAEDGGGVVVEGGQEGEEGGGPRSLPYMMPSATNSSPEGVFQKFKKSLSLRLAKKGSRSESPSSHSAPISQCPPEPSQIESQTLPRRRGSINRDDDNKSSFLFGHPLFRSSKERRRARLKDARSSKCNSGDSGDSGIELVSGSGHVTSLDMTSQAAEVDANNYMDPAFVASLADDGSGLRDLNPRAVRRTHSDVGGVVGRASLHYSRQLSTPQPIKLRPAHRLPQHTGSLGKSKSLKRSKASSHLRRSISQPLDLDKAYDTPISTLRKCRSPTNAQNRRQRRPSAGNILNEDNTTSEDEIGMSDSEDFRTDLKRSLEEDDDMIVYAEALWDHVTLDSEELVFKAGDLITVIDSSDKDWWWGRICHRAGWFPAAFVRLLVNQEDHQETSSHDARTSGPARKQSISGLSNDQIRTNVINEIISTERDFVKHLRDVVEGYLRQVRKRPDMFNDERVSSIFGNMEALYQFQSNFLKELEMCIDWKDPHKSCIGAAFIRNREKFEIYSEYCNNHPSAVSSLQELYQDQKYIHFFEACRLLQEMIDISLDGFLLTPVQKICKYPLQLQELLKYTKSDHLDYKSVQGALEAMRDVALLVNERKRRMECLEKIASWQITVEGWEGPELLEDSSQLICQGEVTKGVGGSWPKEVTLFLFDHQLVYCKRDLLKRNTFVYRGRLNLDMCEIVDLPDGKDSSLNINAHNAWKIHSLEKNKWYTFSCKMASEKQKWMEAFRRERELVAADESAGFVVAEKAKHLAKVAARNQRNRPKRPRTTKSHKRVQAMTYAQAELLVNVDPEMRSNSLPSGVQPPEGKKKGLWFSFGGHKKGRGSGRTLSQIQHHPV